MTGSLRMRYSKLEEEQFRNLESRVKNVPRTFNIIGKLETRALSTKKTPAEDRDYGKHKPGRTAKTRPKRYPEHKDDAEMKNIVTPSPY